MNTLEEKVEKQALFSIIVPVYNAPRSYLDRCINSITDQTFEALEIIIVNDGSNDGSDNACDEYANGDARIKVIHQKNQGVSVARNTGIEAATADWIMFVDADDWLEQDACERLKQYLDNANCDILMFRAVKEYADRQTQMQYAFQPFILYDAQNVDVREFLYLTAMQPPNILDKNFSSVCYSWDKVYRRSFLIDNKLRYPKGISKSEDKIFILNCFEKLGSLYHVDDTLYHYWIHSSSVCNKYSETADIDRLQLAQLLINISQRMDNELKELKTNSNYNLITKSLMRFLFGIISDVLLLKFYHPDYPHGNSKRRVDARKFINAEPFKNAIKHYNYNELQGVAKIKKFLLSNNSVSIFGCILNLHRKLTRKIFISD